MSSDTAAMPVHRSARDWLVDLTCMLGVLLVGLFIWFDPELRRNTGFLLGLDVVAALLSTAALWWRRRWPVQIALGVAALGRLLGRCPACRDHALHRRRSPQHQGLVLVTAANLAGGCFLIVWQPDPTTAVPLDLLLTVLITIAVIAWGMFLRARRQLVASLKERAERAEAEQHWRFDQGRQLERTRIAREMHDVLGHRISLISMHAGALELRAGTADEDVVESAAIIRASAHQALQDLREVIGVLRTDPEDDPVSERPQPTLEDVPGLIEESQQAGMNIIFQFNVAEAEDGAPSSLGRTAYRIVQEGLTNSRKHAPGAAVLVTVHGRPGNGLTVELCTRKPIRTTAETAPVTSGQGLLGLAERAELIGGRLQHSRTPDGDFLLQCWLPWSAWRVPERQLPYV